MKAEIGMNTINVVAAVIKRGGLHDSVAGMAGFCMEIGCSAG